MTRGEIVCCWARPKRQWVPHLVSYSLQEQRPPPGRGKDTSVHLVVLRTTQSLSMATGRALSPPPRLVAKRHILREVELGEANVVLYEDGEAFSIL